MAAVATAAAQPACGFAPASATAAGAASGAVSAAAVSAATGAVAAARARSAAAAAGARVALACLLWWGNGCTVWRFARCACCATHHCPRLGSHARGARLAAACICRPLLSERCQHLHHGSSERRIQPPSWTQLPGMGRTAVELPGCGAVQAVGDLSVPLSLFVGEEAWGQHVACGPAQPAVPRLYTDPLPRCASESSPLPRDQRPSLRPCLPSSSRSRSARTPVRPLWRAGLVGNTHRATPTRRRAIPICAPKEPMHVHCCCAG